MLYYMIYASKATGSMSDADLLALLDHSKIRNEARGLTGTMLYIQARSADQQFGRFIQVLEGDEHAVKLVYERIKTDSRHHRVTLLNEGVLKARNFEGWHMGFETITAAEFHNRPGYFELNDAFFDASQKKQFNFALNFLKSFYDLRPGIS